MGFLQFIFSNFWVWLGFTILAAGAVNGIVGMANAVSKKGRKIAVYKFGESWRVEIDNATDADVIAALQEKERITQEDRPNGH